MKVELKNQLNEIESEMSTLRNKRHKIITDYQNKCVHELVFRYYSPETFVQFGSTYYVCAHCGLTEESYKTIRLTPSTGYLAIDRDKFFELSVRL